MSLRSILAATALVMASLVAPAASADTSVPTVAWGFAPNSPEGVVVQIEGPKRAWGTRRVARYLDEQIDGLRVHTRGTCADRPWAYCIHVTSKNFGENDWFGLMWRDIDGVTQLQYNEYYLPYYNKKWLIRNKIGCHETLHGFGMDHHELKGCVSNNMNRLWPSTRELNKLRAFYEGQADG